MSLLHSNIYIFLILCTVVKTYICSDITPCRLVNSYHSTRGRIPEGMEFHQHLCKNLGSRDSHIVIFWVVRRCNTDVPLKCWYPPTILYGVKTPETRKVNPVATESRHFVLSSSNSPPSSCCI